MIRLILFVFIGLFLLTGTNLGKDFLAEHNLWGSNENLEEQPIWKKLNLQNENQEYREVRPVENESQPNAHVEKSDLLSQLPSTETLTKVLEVLSFTEMMTLLDAVKNEAKNEEIMEIVHELKERLPEEELEILIQYGQEKLQEYLNKTEE